MHTESAISATHLLVLLPICQTCRHSDLSTDIYISWKEFLLTDDVFDNNAIGQACTSTAGDLEMRSPTNSSYEIPRINVDYNAQRNGLPELQPRDTNANCSLDFCYIFHSTYLLKFDVIALLINISFFPIQIPGICSNLKHNGSLVFNSARIKRAVCTPRRKLGEHLTHFSLQIRKTVFIN